MTGTANEAGKVLATTTTVAGGSLLLANSGLKTLALILVAIGILGAIAIVVTSIIRRLMVRGR